MGVASPLATTRGPTRAKTSLLLGPLRPKPTSKATSGALAANTLGQGPGGAFGNSGHTKWQPEGWDRSVDKKVYTLSVEVLRFIVCLSASILSKG